MVDYKKQGKENRKKGAAFELKTRAELEKQGYFVDKWNNNVDLEKKCIVRAKNKFFRGRPMGLGSGFPDFIAFMDKQLQKESCATNYKVIFVECKINGKLKKIEKEKMRWLVGEGFDCWVAYNEEGKVLFRKFVDGEVSSKVCRKKIGN